MNHEELLAKIDAEIVYCGCDGYVNCGDDNEPWDALRAVVELTKESLGKEKIDFEDDQYDQFDEAYWGGYDAGKRSAMSRIIQAIEKELK